MKKIISFLLTIIMCLAVLPSAFAAEINPAEASGQSNATHFLATAPFTEEEEQFIAENYTTYTLNISIPDDNSSIRSTAKISAIDESYNKAVDFVNSLDLSAHADIKAENLAYLDTLHEAGAKITSYSVLVPLDDGLQIYGNLNGLTYYSKHYGQASYEVLENTEKSSVVLNQFANNVVDFLVDLVGSKVISFTWSRFKELLEIAPNYSVQSGDFIEYKVKVTAGLRGIYVQDVQMFYGNQPSAFVRIYTGEAGTARAYSVYHYATTSGIPEDSGWLGDEEFIATEHYYDKDATLEMAEAIYYNKGVARDYLSDVVIANAEIYFGKS